MASEDTAPGGDDETNKILVTEFEPFVVSATLLMLNGVGKDLDIALAKDTTHSLIENFVTGQESTLVLEQTILNEDENESDNKQAENDDEAETTVGGVNTQTTGVYAFHNKVPSDAFSREDSTQRYLMFIKVAERNLMDDVPSSISRRCQISKTIFNYIR